MNDQPVPGTELSAAPAPARTAPPELRWSFPYPSQRMPVFADRMVATSQPLAVEAGLSMLRAGGNAVDAAVATAISLTVLEPTSNGIGSDAFALFWKDGRLHGLNGSGKAPAAYPADRFVAAGEIGLIGWNPVTVPGAVDLWRTLSRDHGRLPFDRLFEPAIRHAERGFPVAPQTASSWRRAAGRWGDLEAFRDTFLRFGEDGDGGPRTGERVALPDHARTLRAIADTGGDAFYRGELAARIAADAQAKGGTMTEADLAGHSSIDAPPLWIDYRGYVLHELPPNGQGMAACIALGILRHFEIADLDPDCPDVVHLQVEAMKLGLRDIRQWACDPEMARFDFAELLRDDYLAARAKLIDPQQAQDFDHGDPRTGGTVLLCAADDEGTMVTLIQSNYTGFGSGIVVPGTGISMQNRGACFTPEAGHPNEPAGGKRPYQTIIPGFVTRGGEPFMAFGVMGGPMQPQGHAQVVVRMADYGQNPQAALDAPRWQCFDGLTLGIEPGFPDETYAGLEERGHRVRYASRRSVTYGGAQAIMRMPDGVYCGASDLRRDGLAMGY